MRINSLTKPKLAYFGEFCNFDEKERTLFELRSQGIPLEKCAEIMHYSKIKDLSKKVNEKIIDVNDAEKMKAWIENVYWKRVLNE